MRKLLKFYFSLTCHLLHIMLVTISLYIFFPALTQATTAHIDPEIDIIIHNIFDNRKQYLSDELANGLNSEDTNALYNAQNITQPLLTYAIEMKDIGIMSDLADIYLTAYSYLQTKNRAIYYYWDSTPLVKETVHDVVDASGTQISAEMWLGTPITIGSETLGGENLLNSSQFLYALSKLANGILSIPSIDRTTSMNTFMTNYVPVILSHYERWIFSANGVFQVTGWNNSVRGLYNHEDFLEAKYNGDFGSVPSYLESVTDTDLWIIAGVVEMLAANDKDSTTVPIDSTTKANLLSYIDLATDLIASRMSDSSLTKFDGTTAVTGVNFDLGIWDEQITYAYTGYDGATNPSGLPENRAENVGWDISHARRFVHVFNTLYNNLSITNQTFPSITTMHKLANQLLYGAFNKDLNEPLTSNFMDGCNGWYRVGYGGFPGYAPYDMSDAIFLGGYMFWSEFNADMLLLRDAFWEKVDAMLANDVSGHFRHLVVSDTEFYGNGNPCVLNSYLTFDGTNYLSAGVDQTISSPTGTIELWFKTDSTNYGDLLNIRENGYNDYLLLRHLSDGRILFQIEDDNVVKLALTTTETIQTGKWNHLAIVQDGVSAKIYLNGDITTITGINSDYWTDHLCIIGTLIGGSSWNKFIGDIDGLHIYSEALSAAQLSSNYLKARLIGHWTFDAVESYVTNNATSATGLIGNGRSFDGSSQIISAYADQDLASKNGSISLWFKPNSLNRQEPLIYIYEAASTDYLLIRKTLDNKILLLIEDDNIAKTVLYTAGTVTAGEWNHLAITHDGTSAKIYLNGVLETLTGTNSTYWTDHLTINFVLFGRASWSPGYYYGIMDEIKFFQGVMTVGNVAKEYCNGLSGGKKVVNCTFDSSEEEYLISSNDTCLDGKICNSAEFNGTNQYISLTTDSAMSSPTGTIQLWFRPDLSNERDLIHILESGYTDYLVVRTTIDDKIWLLIEDGNILKTNLKSTGTFNVGEWNHLAITHDGTSAKIYLNGVLETLTGTNSTYWTDHLSINAVWIGKSSWYYFDGQMDELEMYNYALSQNEIINQYKRPDMISGWEFNKEQDINDREFISTYYGTDFNTASSEFLLKFLPGFLEK
jgi:hypothetical protein